MFTPKIGEDKPSLSWWLIIVLRPSKAGQISTRPHITRNFGSGFSKGNGDLLFQANLGWCKMFSFGQESLLLGHLGKSPGSFFGDREIGRSEDKVASKMMTGSYTTIF